MTTEDIQKRKEELIADRNEHVQKYEDMSNQLNQIRIKIEQLSGGIVALEEFAPDESTQGQPA